MPADRSLAHRALVFLGSLGLVGLLGLVDFLTGYEVSSSIFYLAPVSWTAWQAGRAPAIVVAGVSAVAWWVADNQSGHLYSHPLIPFWNALVRMGFFLIVSWLLTALRRENEEIRRLVRVDPLTGLANTRGLMARMELERVRSARSGGPLTLAYLDLDGFKRVNDQRGHHAGDEVLCLVAAILTHSVRGTDLVARLGGDEYAIVLPDTDRRAALTVLSRAHAAIGERLGGGALPVTCSVGAVTFTKVPPSTDEMLSRADALMYEVKQSGKDRVLVELDHGVPDPVQRSATGTASEGLDRPPA